MCHPFYNNDTRQWPPSTLMTVNGNADCGSDDYWFIMCILIDGPRHCLYITCNVRSFSLLRALSPAHTHTVHIVRTAHTHIVRTAHTHAHVSPVSLQNGRRAPAVGGPRRLVEMSSALHISRGVPALTSSFSCARHQPQPATK